MRLRRLAKKLPPIARRDAELARRKQQVAELTKSVDKLTAKNSRLRDDLKVSVAQRNLKVASFHRNLATLQRTTVDLRSIDPQLRHPLRQVPFKLRNYRLAASHGVPVPTVLRTWSRPSEMDLDELPDAFVVKSDGGAGSHGVLPLRRTSADHYETLDGERAFSGDQVRAHFQERVDGRKISGPFFAEEVLRQPGGGPIPDDIKIYTMYGDVQQVLLRRVSRHGDLSSISRRFVAGDGSDLGDVLMGSAPDLSIPVPAELDVMVGIARHLSLAVGLPFVRVDLYDTQDGVVLGEVTRAPGGAQRYRPDHDETMGLAWEHAAYRLDLDLLAGRPPGVIYGDRPAPNPYPAGHVSQGVNPGAWQPRVMACEQWCGPSTERRG